jgi:hypothetical protein
MIRELDNGFKKADQVLEAEEKIMADCDCNDAKNK